MNVGKLANFLRRFGDALAAKDELHPAEGCWIASAIVARARKLEEENRELRAKVERLQQALNEAVPMYSVKRQGGAQ